MKKIYLYGNWKMNMTRAETEAFFKAFTDASAPWASRLERKLEIFRKIGRRSPNRSIIAPGRRSKFSPTIAAIFSSAIFPVPNVSTLIESGFATPIA